MDHNSDFNDADLKKKIEILLNESYEIKKWNEGILIKSLILLPGISFIIGLFIANRLENIMEIFLVSLYPLSIISIGLITLFSMRRNSK